MARKFVDTLRDVISDIPVDRRVVKKLVLSEQGVFISALVRNSDNTSYKEYKLPNTEEEVLLYWINDKYDEIEDSLICHHFKSGLEFVYDNGIKSLTEYGCPNFEEDSEDTLYIKVDSVSSVEYQFNTVEKKIAHITPHVDAITAYIYDVVESNGTYELIDQRVIGYKITDVDVVVGDLQSDWKSNQLIGNLFVIDDYFCNRDLTIDECREILNKE